MLWSRFYKTKENLFRIFVLKKQTLSWFRFFHSFASTWSFLRNQFWPAVLFFENLARSGTTLNKCLCANSFPSPTGLVSINLCSESTRVGNKYQVIRYWKTRVFQAGFNNCCFAKSDLLYHLTNLLHSYDICTSLCFCLSCLLRKKNSLSQSRLYAIVEFV